MLTSASKFVQLSTLMFDVVEEPCENSKSANTDDDPEEKCVLLPVIETKSDCPAFPELGTNEEIACAGSKFGKHNNKMQRTDFSLSMLL